MMGAYYLIITTNVSRAKSEKQKKRGKSGVETLIHGGPSKKHISIYSFLLGSRVSYSRSLTLTVQKALARFVY